MSSKICHHCGRSDSPRYYRDRCVACYYYLLRHGQERPMILIEQHRRRPRGPFRQICKCGRPTFALGMCSGCYHYQRNNGRPRPRHLWNRPDNCLNPACRKPLADEPRVVKGLCQNCYVYRWKHGEHRPTELTGGNRWCECGRPATRRLQIVVGCGGDRQNPTTKREWLDLCAECAQFELQGVA